MRRDAAVAGDLDFDSDARQSPVKAVAPGARLLAATGTIVAFTVVGKALGILQQSVMASHFGVGQQLDVYFVAYSVPNFFMNVLLLGMLSPALIPTFTRMRRDEPGHLPDVAGGALLSVTILMSAVAVVGVVAAPYIVGWLAPGFSTPTRNEAVSLTRWLLPLLPLAGIAAVLRGVLFSFERFAYPLFAFNLASFAVIVAVLGLASRLGIYSLAVGVVFGAALAIPVFFPGLRAIRFRFRWNMTGISTGLRSTAILFTGMVAVALATEGARVGARIFASYMPTGSIATLEYALSFEKLVVGSFAIAAATAAYPLLTLGAASLSDGRFQQTLRLTVRHTLLITVPITAVLVIQRVDIVTVWLAHGTFSVRDALAVADAFAFLSVALLVWAFMQVLVYAYLAIGTVRPLAIGAIASAAGTTLLCWPLGKVMGVSGLALAFSVAALVSNIVLWRLLGDKVPGMGIARDDIAFAGKVIAATVLASIAAFTVVSLPTDLHLVSSTAHFLRLALGLSAFGFTFLLAIRVLRVEELSGFQRLFGLVPLGRISRLLRFSQAGRRTP